MDEQERKPCNPHPKAPHGLLRNASYSLGRYVCECEYWEPEQQTAAQWVGLTDEETMDKQDIIAWARKAGFVVDEKAQQYQPNCIFHTHHMVDELLERFAAIVAKAEREACAKVCEDVGEESDSFTRDILRCTAAAIRERSANARARGNT